MVHIYGLYDLLGPVVAFFARKHRIPYVVEPIGMMRPIDRSLRLKRVWHRLLGLPLITNASLLIATSQQEQRELLSHPLPRAQVALRYNGVDLNEYSELTERGIFRKRWGIADDEPVVLFLGRLIPRKGVDLLITAFADTCPETGRLVIAGPEGETQYLAKMRELARARGVEARTIFAGPLYGDEKKSALVDCDLFALPSRYENFANSVAEAIACSRPVIVSDCCGISEFVHNEAGLVIRRDISALTAALRQLLSDRDLYLRLQAGCPAVAARLSWAGMLDTQEALYARARIGIRPAAHCSG